MTWRGAGLVVVGIMGMGIALYGITKDRYEGESLNPEIPSTFAAGREIFYGKGRCGLCHTLGVARGGKCPNLDYAGDRLTREFMMEAMMQPDAYIKLDFDPPAPKRYPAHMPQVNQPPIGLTLMEMEQVIEFVRGQHVEQGR